MIHKVKRTQSSKMQFMQPHECTRWKIAVTYRIRTICKTRKYNNRLKRLWCAIILIQMHIDCVVLLDQNFDVIFNTFNIRFATHLLFFILLSSFPSHLFNKGLLLSSFTKLLAKSSARQWQIMTKINWKLAAHLKRSYILLLEYKHFYILVLSILFWFSPFFLPNWPKSCIPCFSSILLAMQSTPSKRGANNKICLQWVKFSLDGLQEHIFIER